MKRQHPTDPNLFWCPKCEQWGVFGKIRNTNGEYYLRNICNDCRCKQEKLRRDKKPKREKITPLARSVIARRYYELNTDKVKKRSKLWAEKNPEKYKTSQKKYTHKEETRVKVNNRNRAHGVNISDTYLKGVLRHVGINKTNPETIELKRQQIILFRNIKQLGRIEDGRINKECNGNQ